MACSTYIQTFTIFDVSWLSFLTIWLPFAVLGGILKEHCFTARSVLILNPLSAMTWSNGSKRSRNPESLTKWMSELLPSSTGETQETAWFGMTHTKNVTVQWCLQSLHKHAWAAKLTWHIQKYFCAINCFWK